jgi:hypothetical protein
MAGTHVQIYLWTFDQGWPQKYIIQKWMSDIYNVNIKVNSLVMCSCTKHVGQKFLTNPDASGKIRNNWEGELAIGNYRDPISPDSSGKIRSVESQFLESQLFCKFLAKCQIPDFLQSVPGNVYWERYFTKIWESPKIGDKKCTMKPDSILHC